MLFWHFIISTSAQVLIRISQDRQSHWQIPTVKSGRCDLSNAKTKIGRLLSTVPLPAAAVGSAAHTTQEGFNPPALTTRSCCILMVLMDSPPVALRALCW